MPPSKPNYNLNLNRMAGGGRPPAAPSASAADVEQMQAQMAQMQAQEAQLAAAMAGGGGSDLMTQPQQLAQMKDAGALTEAEFAAANATLLA